ncbi:hypothetical protein AMTRI_Chr04g185970 [Amborella trichopoda]
MLDLLPCINVSKVYLVVRVQQEFSGKYMDESKQEDCSMCLCRFVANTKTWVMPCNHKFHSKCILKWLVEYNRSCPLCRCQLRESTNRSCPLCRCQLRDSPSTIAGCKRVEISPYFLFLS